MRSDAAQRNSGAQELLETGLKLLSPRPGSVFPVLILGVEQPGRDQAPGRKLKNRCERLSRLLRAEGLKLDSRFHLMLPLQICAHIEPQEQVILVDARIRALKRKRFAMHGRAAAVRRETG